MQYKYIKEFEEKGSLPALSFPGGYPLLYITRDGEIFCNECASKNVEEINNYILFLEGASINCNLCNEEIESAYGDPEEKE